MAKTKWATVTGQRDLGGGVHRIECEADEALGHAPGDYVIVRSTLPNPDKPGEVRKRAYSLSAPADPDAFRAFCLTVAAVGTTSRWLAKRRPGDRFEFTGPWGRDFRARPEDLQGTVHLFATGTGWSPIGAIARAWLRHGQGRLGVWWQTVHVHEPQFVETLQGASGVSARTGPDIASELPADPTALYFLAGDGTVLAPIRDRLHAAGIHPSQVRVQYFFNKPGALA